MALNRYLSLSAHMKQEQELDNTGAISLLLQSCLCVVSCEGHVKVTC